MSFRLWMACAALLAVHGALSIHALRQHSLTVDEGAHVLSGLEAWQAGRNDLYPVNPPLVKLLASLGVLTLHPALPANLQSAVSLEDQLIRANPGRLEELTARGRYPIVALSLIGGWVVFSWSRRLFGAAAGLVGLTLWAFCPNILCWSGTATVDLGATVFGLIAVYALWCYSRRPCFLNACVVGWTLGLAVLSKFTLLVLYPIFFALWFLAWWQKPTPERASKTLTHWFQFGLAMLLSAIVVNGGYGFEGSGTRLGAFEFQSLALTHSHDGTRINRFRETCVERLPVPLPEWFVRGLDIQKCRAEQLGPGYLGGQWRQGGWWYFYLYVLAVKVPLGTWLLAGLCLFLILLSSGYRASFNDECMLFLPAAAIVFLISTQMRDVYASIRYILPALPFVFIWLSRAGALMEELWEAIRGRTARLMARRSVGLACGVGFLCSCLAWNVSEALWVHPHYLSYFNELAGGPESGWKHLLESNMDWGQDLRFLKRWLDEHPEARRIRLAYYGGVDPHLVGLDYISVPRRSSALKPLRPGWYAVSVNLLCGAGLPLYDEDGRLILTQPGELTYFQSYKPVAKAGYSIFIYHLTSEDVESAGKR
jgi:hypothetical protein